ncbi:PRELI domain-containing protein 1, mitochondrial-like [Saccoglossus kowalevskii]|uniref:PRELI domain-containing protein 1, mitochondrial-like n=1 Tax=Saccoglossus kowalevskii TaxID=10224 RepID=A0ABM0GZK6_SACKO|nr:PREDICTED: PRELI domain-containing protein 1, mitochondrial-like [Saccoglossus kowalevskii]
MKYYEGFAQFKYKWDQVVSSFFQRYPNPRSKHVLTEDMLSYHVKGNKLFTKKLYTKTNKLPKWGSSFVTGPKQVCVIEETILDPKAKKLTTYSRNVGYLSSIMVVEERCEYTLNTEEQKWTSLKREAWVTSSIMGFSHAIQAFGIERFKKNCQSTLKGFQYILEMKYGSDKMQDASTSESKLKETAKNAREKASKMAAKAGIVQY